MSKDESFESECRAKFLDYCQLYKVAKFHAVKRDYAARAYGVIDDWLDWVDIQTL